MWSKIKKEFPSIGGLMAITESGSAVAIFYANTLANIPTGDEELKKIQINLIACRIMAIKHLLDTMDTHILNPK